MRDLTRSLPASPRGLVLRCSARGWVFVHRAGAVRYSSLPRDGKRVNTMNVISMGSEVGQRAQERVPFSRRAHLHIDGLPDSVPARIVNLSPRGAYLRAEKLPPVGTTFLCSFVLGGDETVLRCRLRWIDFNWTPGQDVGPGAGVEFLNPGPRERELLAVAVSVTPTPVPAPH